jgi:hypothetical protein
MKCIAPEISSYSSAIGMTSLCSASLPSTLRCDVVLSDVLSSGPPSDCTGILWSDTFDPVRSCEMWGIVGDRDGEKSVFCMDACARTLLLSPSAHVVYVDAVAGVDGERARRYLAARVWECLLRGSHAIPCTRVILGQSAAFLAAACREEDKEGGGGSHSFTSAAQRAAWCARLSSLVEGIVQGALVRWHIYRPQSMIQCAAVMEELSDWYCCALDTSARSGASPPLSSVAPPFGIITATPPTPFPSLLVLDGLVSAQWAQSRAWLSSALVAETQSRIAQAVESIATSSRRRFAETTIIWTQTPPFPSFHMAPAPPPPPPPPPTPSPSPVAAAEMESEGMSRQQQQQQQQRRRRQQLTTIEEGVGKLSAVLSPSLEVVPTAKSASSKRRPGAAPPDGAATDSSSEEGEMQGTGGVGHNGSRSNSEGEAASPRKKGVDALPPPTPTLAASSSSSSVRAVAPLSESPTATTSAATNAISMSTGSALNPFVALIPALQKILQEVPRKVLLYTCAIFSIRACAPATSSSALMVRRGGAGAETGTMMARADLGVSASSAAAVFESASLDTPSAVMAYLRQQQPGCIDCRMMHLLQRPTAPQEGTDRTTPAPPSLVSYTCSSLSCPPAHFLVTQVIKQQVHEEESRAPSSHLTIPSPAGPFLRAGDKLFRSC